MSESVQTSPPDYSAETVPGPIDTMPLDTFPLDTAPLPGPESVLIPESFPPELPPGSG